MAEHFDRDIRYHAAIAHEYDAVITQPRAFPNDLLFGALDPLIVPGARMSIQFCSPCKRLGRRSLASQQREARADNQRANTHDSGFPSFPRPSPLAPRPCLRELPSLRVSVFLPKPSCCAARPRWSAFSASAAASMI